jgi:hypothetical protein
MIYPVYKNYKIIGYIDTEKSIYISDRTRQHIFLKYGNGFGISVKVLDLLESQGIKLIIIRFEDNNLLSAPLDSFLVHGIEYNDFSDKQLILPFVYFNKKRVDERQVSL